MNLSQFDWLIVSGIFLLLGGIAWFTKRYTRSVADFLAADRSAGRYLLTMASGMAGLGTITMVANFEQFYSAGFAAGWWGMMLGPVTLLVTLSGFVIYRYRETRAMTMAQFFERRYSRPFRVFAGLLAFISGVVNYGIFPGVTARFIIYFTGLPPTFVVGGLELPTLAPVMFVMLGAALLLTMTGGQVAVMVTDFLQGQLVNITMLAIMVLLMVTVGFGNIIEGLQMAPAGESKINPFDQANVPDFNVWFFVMMAVLGVYGTMAWQGGQGYNAAARTAHEAKMARILAEFRGLVTYFVIMLLPVAAYAIMHHPAFTGMAESVQAQLDTIGDEQIRTQMTVPLVASRLLPTGLMGLFAVVILAAAISTDDTYLHSWGSIFIQDVVMPFRRKRLAPKTHLRLLRLSMLGVAVFAFMFSLLFPLRAYIFMFFQITGAIYLGGAGSVIIGGLYWNRGTAAGAWWSMAIGSILAVGGIVLQNVLWPWLATGVEFPFNGMQMGFFSAVVSMAVYFGVSLLTCREPIDMDALLHRGPHAVGDDHTAPGNQPATGLKTLVFTNEFTTGDKAIYILKLSIFLLFFIIFVVGTVWGLTGTIPEDLWVKYWWFKLIFTLVVGTATTVWFILGGIKDLVQLFRTLATKVRDSADDGFVTHHLGQPSEDDSLLEVGPDFYASNAEALKVSSKRPAQRPDSSDPV